MKYKCLCGEMVESGPNPVTHTCDNDGPEGVYTSLETTGAATEIGIKQIQISRSVSNGQMTVTIVESNDDELLAYLEGIKNNNLYNAG